MFYGEEIILSLQYQLKMDVRVDHANPYTNQIFQEAVIRNDLAVVKLLLKYGIYPRRNERNRQGLTGLQQSVLDGNVKMSILLLEAGADIEAKTSNGWTCLHIASALGDLDILITMINHCADLVSLTKNEELPIDLAATRDIKIKLAKEMSRVGYSELAQWYMRKLAAREGVFYVLSTNTLLDLACDDNYDKSYSNTYPYYMTNCTDAYTQQHQSPARANISNSTVWKRSEDDSVPVAKQNAVWLEVGEPKNTTYLTFASGYLSEAIFDHSSGEYKRVRNSASTSSAGSPSRKNVSVSDGVPNIPSFGSTSEVMEPDTLSRNSGTLRRSGSYKKPNSMQRKPSKIELHIDYTNSTEDDDAEEDEYDAENVTSTVPTDNKAVLQKSPVFEQNKTNTSQYQTSELDKLKQTRGVDKVSEVEPADSGDIRNRNVRFTNIDNANEFCNCPNCKKMGYAFSPDIRTTSRKTIHVDKSYILSPDKGLSYGAFPIQSQYYPPTTTGKHGLYYGNENDYKPRKRKKKLFSGIKSMFKDSIRVHRTTEHMPMTEDAGILFAVSLRDRDKSKTIKERHVIRKSNSFSGRNGYSSEEVSVYPHNHVVPPPSRFADSERKDEGLYNESEQEDVFEMEQWFEYGHQKKHDRLQSQQYLRDFCYDDQPMVEHHSENCNDEFCCAYNKKELLSSDVRMNLSIPRSLVNTNTCLQGKNAVYYLEDNT